MEKQLSIYLHFPFCKRKCYYCDFNSASGQEGLVPDYVEALISEMQSYLPQRRHLSSIYFGGGTPSYLPVEELVKVMNYIKAHFLISTQTEITLELNPGTIGVEDLIFLKEAGFNRLSIGLQAAQDRLLESIGRIHTWSEFNEVFELSREIGFTNLGVDLIFGLPDQSLADWEETLRKVVALNPEHISAYGLQLESGTKLAELVSDGILKLPTEDEVVAMMRLAMGYLPSQGYEQYEISNYARSGFSSVHNLGYWCGRDYLGFGSGAYSTIYGERRANLKDAQEYISLLKDNNSVVATRENIGPDIAVVENVMLGLRLRSGINSEKLKTKYGVDLLTLAADEIHRFEADGLLRVRDGRMILTDDGILLSNRVIGDLIAKL